MGYFVQRGLGAVSSGSIADTVREALRQRVSGLCQRKEAGQEAGDSDRDRCYERREEEPLELGFGWDELRGAHGGGRCVW